MAGDTLTVRAFAKVNLSLRVVGTRADGFHELQTVFQSLALHDTVRLTRARGPLRVECDDPACPQGRRNLVWRAAAKLWRASGRRGAPRGAVVRIAKAIPMRAGLGGGSSDAAAALRALAAWWRVDASRLPAIAGALGADVAYFLVGGTALGLERGDVLFPLADAPRRWVVLALPAVGVGTADAYGWWDRAPSRVARADRPGSNDLQAPVVAHHPEIGRLARALRRAGAEVAAMSGSGAAVYGLFAVRRAAVAAARAVAAGSPGAAVALVTSTLDRAGCRALGRPRSGRIR
jgi:4-diphosphocytidyl-2-C-methyl-D-erythritol kinase